MPEVDKEEPSSWTVTPLPPPAIVIVLVAPVPDATTPDPTKLSVVPVVDNAEPSSWTVTPPPAEIPVSAEPSNAGRAPLKLDDGTVPLNDVAVRIPVTTAPVFVVVSFWFPL